MTPMCTQLTYEGLIDEVFGIKNGVVQLELGADGMAPAASTACCVHVGPGNAFGKRTDGSRLQKVLCRTVTADYTVQPVLDGPRCVDRNEAEGSAELFGPAVQRAA